MMQYSSHRRVPWKVMPGLRASTAWFVFADGTIEIHTASFTVVPTRE